MVDLSVVIPAYNEADRLGPSLERALAYVERRGLDAEILVADDGSRDRTVEIASFYADRGVRVIRLPENRGKGAAVKAGVAASRGQRILVSDADFSTPIEEIEKLEARLPEAEVVIGSRSVPGADIVERQPFYRELMGKTFNRIIRLFWVRGLADTQCGFKLLAGEPGRAIGRELTIEGFAYDVELIWLARRHGLRVAEVGVVWRNSAASKVHPLRAPIAMLWDLARMPARHRARHRISRRAER